MPLPFSTHSLPSFLSSFFVAGVPFHASQDLQPLRPSPSFLCCPPYTEPLLLLHVHLFTPLARQPQRPYLERSRSPCLQYSVLDLLYTFFLHIVGLDIQHMQTFFSQFMFYRVSHKSATFPAHSASPLTCTLLAHIHCLV